MNNYQIDLFNSLVKTNSFSRTAREFNTNYQNVIYQITRLEEELGTSLFTRSRNGNQLSHSGKIFASFAQTYAENYANIITTISNLSTNLLFGIDFSVTHPIISQYSLTYSNENILFFADNYSSLYNDLLKDEINCYFGYEDNWDRSISFCPIFEDNLCLMVSKKHPLSSKTSILFSDLIGNNIDISIHTSVNSCLPLDELSKTNTIITNSAFSSFSYSIRTGKTISFAPSIYQYYSSSDFSFIPIENYKLTFGLFYKYRSKTIDDLIEKFKRSADTFSIIEQ